MRLVQCGASRHLWFRKIDEESAPITSPFAVMPSPSQSTNMYTPTHTEAPQLAPFSDATSRTSTNFPNNQDTMSTPSAGVNQALANAAREFDVSTEPLVRAARRELDELREGVETIPPPSAQELGGAASISDSATTSQPHNAVSDTFDFDSVQFIVDYRGSKPHACGMYNPVQRSADIDRVVQDGANSGLGAAALTLHVAKDLASKFLSGDAGTTVESVSKVCGCIPCINRMSYSSIMWITTNTIVQDLYVVERRSVAHDIAAARAKMQSKFSGDDTYSKLISMNDQALKKGMYFLTNRVRKGQHSL